MHVILSGSEGSLHFIFNKVPGCFTEFTLTSFASLRACPEQREGTIRCGKANGFSMTVFELLTAVAFGFPPVDSPRAEIFL